MRKEAWIGGRICCCREPRGWKYFYYWNICASLPNSSKISDCKSATGGQGQQPKVLGMPGLPSGVHVHQEMMSGSLPCSSRYLRSSLFPYVFSLYTAIVHLLSARWSVVGHFPLLLCSSAMPDLTSKLMHCGLDGSGNT